MNKNNEVLLVKRRENVIDGGLRSLPGGRREKFENILFCLKRELSEELGINITEAVYFDSKKIGETQADYFLVKDVIEDKEISLNIGELDHYGFFSYDLIQSLGTLAFEQKDILDNVFENQQGKKELLNCLNGKRVLFLDGNHSSINVEKLIQNNSLSKKIREKLKRANKLLSLPDLSLNQTHPIGQVTQKIENSPSFQCFDTVFIPEKVSEFETFDLFDYLQNHSARSESDSYFLNKNADTKESILLRPHMSVMRYYYLTENRLQELSNSGKLEALSYGKVYRLDHVDKTHHECFHQIDGLKIVEKEHEIISEEVIEKVLIDISQSVFGSDIPWRKKIKKFPFTEDGWEIEVNYDDRRIKVAGAGLVSPKVLDNLGVDSKKYNGWAFGISVERLAMAIKGVEDIRQFRSTDTEITKQRGDLNRKFVEPSKFPPVYKDISLLRKKEEVGNIKKGDSLIGIESTIFLNLVEKIRNGFGNNLFELIVSDVYENEQTLEKGNVSLTFRIVLRSKDKTLSNIEVNRIYSTLRKELESIGYKLR